jgi:hypothetical protein
MQLRASNARVGCLDDGNDAGAVDEDSVSGEVAFAGENTPCLLYTF